ncbi:Calcium/calmodulin-dependent 3',5'-cyclic nucleotide phosphodiesterase 1B [Perkinsus chesapeaki]|uniref:Calcium/calmodulin-dependent 3',5'-cyclic nucleotide phosphodiesterase 1B n=1 Tax=Perkinsus chesapeaki TaxID=330153 RepID=A0A7J6MQG6_PERCH|nr:Calcium/calmodulin-dependent 3',5'-cyclic nucleotide phosphodiesterase 1B [Perkinsus chesapeaki]
MVMPCSPTSSSASCFGNFMTVTCEVFKAKRLSSVSSISTQDSDGCQSLEASELERAVTDFNWNIFNFVDTLRDPTSEVLKSVGQFLFKRAMNTDDHDFHDEGEWYPKAVKWLVLVQEAYNDVPFHNVIHASDVAIALDHLLQIFEPNLDPLDALACYCAALAHDVYHPGFSNRYVIATSDSIEGDTHPLETMHAKEAVRMLNDSGMAEVLGDERVQLINRMIMATDMQQHDMWVEKAMSMACLPKEDLLCLLLHAADISNPARSREVMQQWSIRCLTEFWHEGDLFRDRGLEVPPTLPSRPLSNVELAKQQLGFSKYFVRPLLAAMCDSAWTWLDNIDDNIKSREALIKAYAVTAL